ncbi:inositol 1,4,5-triphosphate receptor associated 2 [Perognathus longimembris pacificus]|uniref:inositol 1,4,5-triphosphate receptor associated 2 n=1 Tax=Perognathus longimembris pacificus TaxID=214514 RepID=UPI0020187E9E|nr:inositol 1,4,5-triphosphate receptor associated 2 [Perognathus longimembris pacificus]
MNGDRRMDENGIEPSGADSSPAIRDNLSLADPGNTEPTENTVISTDSRQDILHMASSDLDCKSVCEEEEGGKSMPTMASEYCRGRVQSFPDTRPADPLSLGHGLHCCPLFPVLSPLVILFPLMAGPNPAEKPAGQETETKTEAVPPLDTQEEPPTVEEHGKEGATGDTKVSSAPVTTVKSVNFRQSDNPSANEKEVEAEFLRLSLGFKCDWFTLEKRMKLEERSRDLAEENLKKEILHCLKLIESLIPLCEEDNQAQEIIKKLEKSIAFLSQCATRAAGRAEMLGAINQESRVSKAVEVMIQHVENLKRMYAKEHAELEELKLVLTQNERPLNSLEDDDDCQIKKRSASLNSKPSSLRRGTIASLPRNLGSAGMVAGLDSYDRFSRRASSWRVLGSKQSEHRPSLHRFISTYSWADAEEERHELKTQDDSEPPGEETVERTRKPSLSEKKNTPSKWDMSSFSAPVASWAAHIRTAVGKGNKALWLSGTFLVLSAALMSFLAGWFLQGPVEAAPTQGGDPWGSLEHILWPLARLQPRGPPPV